MTENRFTKELALQFTLLPYFEDEWRAPFNERQRAAWKQLVRLGYATSKRIGVKQEYVYQKTDEGRIQEMQYHIARRLDKNGEFKDGLAKA